MRAYPEAYVLYLSHFHGDRDWFECHEILEEYWKSEPQINRSSTWVGLIQIAVGLYHQRRGNLAGALKMLRSAWASLSAGALNQLGLDGEETLRRVEARVRAIDTGNASLFHDMNLPILDTELLQACKERCAQLGMLWEGSSRMDEPELIHRHTMRDRSEVIEARRMEAERRRQQRGVER